MSYYCRVFNSLIMPIATWIAMHIKHRFGEVLLAEVIRPIPRCVDGGFQNELLFCPVISKDNNCNLVDFVCLTVV